MAVEKVWVWPLLGLALLAVSSAAPVLRTMMAVPPLLRASWRQQLTAALVAPVGVWQYRALDADARARARAPAVMARLLGSGLLLAAHFGAWIWSIDHTTLAHSVLLVSANPIILALGRVVGRLPVHVAGELGGAMLGFGGAAVSMVGELATTLLPPPLALNVSAAQDEPSIGGASVGAGERVTLVGDLVCFGSMLLMAVYLVLGRKFRHHPTNLLYVTPLYATASAVAFAATPAAGPLGLIDPTVPLDWIAEAPWVLLLALLPTLVGHSLINNAMRSLRGQVVSVLNMLQFLFAGVLAWVFLSERPQLAFYIAAALVLAAGAVVVLSDRRKTPSEELADEMIETT